MSDKEILVLKVSLGNNKYDSIKIHETDEPEDLAWAFCQKHNLNRTKQAQLEQLIEKEIDLLVERDFFAMKQAISINRSKTPGTPSTHRKNNEPIKEKNKTHALIINKHSDLFLQHMKEERFLTIFNLLRPGRDGKISFGTIANCDLSLPVLQVVLPLISHIKKNKKVLSFKNFKICMERLMANLTAEEKDIIFGSKKWTRV